MSDFFEIDFLNVESKKVGMPYLFGIPLVVFRESTSLMEGFKTLKQSCRTH